MKHSRQSMAPAGYPNGGQISCNADPEDFVFDLLSGNHPKFPEGTPLDLVIPISGCAKVTPFDIQHADQDWFSWQENVLPHMSSGFNTQAAEAIVVQLDAAGAGVADLATVPQRAFGYILTYQIAVNNGVLTRLRVTEDLPDNSPTDDALSRVPYAYELTGNNQWGSTIFRPLHSQLKSVSAAANVSCQGARLRAAILGYAKDAAPVLATLAFLGAPGAVVTVNLIAEDSLLTRRINANRANSLAGGIYKAVASFMAADLEAYEEEVRKSSRAKTLLKKGGNGNGNGNGKG